MAGYKSRDYARALLSRPGGEEFMLGLIKEAAETINLTLGQILQERFKMAQNADVDDKLRDSILKDLTGLFVSDKDSYGESAMRIASSVNKPLALTPSKEIKQETDNAEESITQTGS
jgi:hypothetical protein